MIKSFKYRLHPTKPQQKDLENTLSLCCELYNAALQERRDAYKKVKKSITRFEQINSLVLVKNELPEYKKIHSQVLCNVIDRVDNAYKGFFRRVKKGQKPGFPRFKGKQRYDSFTFPQAYATGVKIQNDGKRVLLHGIGSVKVKLHRDLEGKIKTATIKREGELWYIVFSCEVEPKRLPENENAIGIDLGTNPNFLVTSNGEEVKAPKYYQNAQKKLAKVQQNLSKKKKNSCRYKLIKKQLSKLHRKIANQRKDFHHKLSRRLVNEYGIIVHEDINIQALSQSRLAKGIYDSGWAQFLQMLSYKAEEAGRKVIAVDPKYTSQNCPACGHKEKKPLWIRNFTCPKCNNTFHRDTAAAMNILAKARTEPSAINKRRSLGLQSEESSPL